MLSAPVLSAALRAAMLSNTALRAVDGPELTALCDTIAQQVVLHITTNAVVNVAVTTAGTAAAQTGTGVGTVS